jgi:bifunctional non-homologous end joining protein LigD
MLESGTLVPVGNCTVPANYAIPAIGAFVEVKYIYAYRGGSLIQAQYHGERDDVTIADCDVDQLKYYKSDAPAA